MLLALLLRPAAKRLEPELRTPGTVATDAFAAIVVNGGSYAGAYAALAARAALPALAGVRMLGAAAASVRPSSARPQ